MHGAGAGDDQEAGVATGGHGVLDLGHHLHGRDEVLDATVVAHPLRGDLILDLDGGGSGRLDVPDRPGEVDGIAEPDPSVDDEREVVRPTILRATSATSLVVSSASDTAYWNPSAPPLR